jgi:hypothetical protein
LRVGAHQCLHVRDHGIDVVGDLLPVGVSDPAKDLICHVVEDRADLREIVGRGGRRVAGGQRGGRGRIRQHGIGIDGVDDAELAGANRLLCAGGVAD